MYLVTELRPDHEVWGKSPVSEPRGFILGMKEPGGGFRSRGRSRGPARTGHVPKRSEGCAEAGGSGGRTSGGLDPPHGPRAVAFGQKLGGLSNMGLETSVRPDPF